MARSLAILLAAAALGLMLCRFSPAAWGAEFDPGLAPFWLEVNDRVIVHRIVHRALMPNKKVVLAFKQTQTPANAAKAEDPADKRRGKRQRVRSSAPYSVSFLGQIHGVQDKEFTIKMPASSGTFPMKVRRNRDGAEITIVLFGVVPASEIRKGKLNGYTIGSYPPPLRGLEIYLAPTGYIEVTDQNRNMKVSPHFTLGQFLCKQAEGPPRYVVLLPRLLTKLEFLLAAVNQKGIRADGFFVMSGYRTPYYNRLLGNVPSGRHLYGGAADIYVDVKPADGRMDDLNRDGRVDVKDARVLYELADKLAGQTKRSDLAGGVGLYSANASHGPFIHIDVRGHRARW